MLRRISCILLLTSAVASAVESPATRPATAPDAVAFWLDRAVREAADVEDPVLRSEAYAKAAVLMARLGEVAQYERTVDLARRALEAAPAKPARSPVEDAISAATTPLLSTMARGGEVAGAKAFAEERAKANKHHLPIYFATIAGVQAASGDVDGALKTAGALNERDRRPVLQQVVSALAARRDFAEAERVAGMIPERELASRDALRAIAAGRARAGQFNAALAMADRLPYDHDKHAVFNYVLDVQLEAGDWAAARATAAGMPLGERRSGQHPPPEQARAIAYAKIGWAQLKVKDIAAARETTELLDGDFRAQLESAIVSAHVDAGDLAAARRAAAAIPRDAKGFLTKPPWVNAYETLAAALAEAGEFDEAVKVARALPVPAETLLRVAELAAGKGQHDRAKELLRELTERGTDKPLWADLEFGDGSAVDLRLARLEKALGNIAPYDAALGDLKRRAAEGDDPADRETANVQLFWLYVAEDDLEGARQLAGALPMNQLSLGIVMAAAEAARLGKVERANVLVSFLPPGEARASAVQALLANDPKAPAARDAIAEQIGRLPTAYDRSRAYLARAEAALADREKGAILGR